MKDSTAVAIVIVLALVAGIVGFNALGTPAQRQAADERALIIAPTATAMAVRAQVVAPAQAQADAASILANNQLRIEQDQALQEQQHTIAMTTLEVSRTLAAGFARAKAAMNIGEAEAANEARISEIQTAAFNTRITSYVYLILTLGVFIAVSGGSLAVVRWLGNRAKVVRLSTGEEIVFIGGRQINQPNRALGPITDSDALPGWAKSVALLMVVKKAIDSGTFDPAQVQVVRQALSTQHSHPLPASEQTMKEITMSAQITAAMMVTDEQAGLHQAVANLRSAAAQPVALIEPPIIEHDEDEAVYQRLLEVTRS